MSSNDCRDLEGDVHGLFYDVTYVCNTEDSCKKLLLRIVGVTNSDIYFFTFFISADTFFSVQRSSRTLILTQTWDWW
jgi:hypothetical protein